MNNAIRFFVALACAIISVHHGIKAGCADEISSFDTLHGKHVVGYQGWFSCPQDNSGGGWRHWFRSRVPKNEDMVTDLWPDTSELGSSELCDTGLKDIEGNAANAFSSMNEETVERHLRWMKNYNIDGLALQRFLSDFKRPNGLEWRNRVLTNVRHASKKNGRGYFIMYDISGADPNTWASDLLDDWTNLVDKGVTKDEFYWKHKGSPVVAIWGIGFKTRPGTPDEVIRLVQELKSKIGGATLIGGVPTFWRSLSNDAKPDKNWITAYRSFDVISPWTVGRYRDILTWSRYLATASKDMQFTRENGIDYMPVAFPGYSFGNAKGRSELVDEIPRRCGEFYSMQLNSYVLDIKAVTLYTAMFDELDEATAIMKIATDERKTPKNSTLVRIKTPNCDVNSDFYLKLAGTATENLRRTYSLFDGIHGKR